MTTPSGLPTAPMGYLIRCAGGHYRWRRDAPGVGIIACPWCRERPAQIAEVIPLARADAPLIEVRQQDWIPGFAAFLDTDNGDGASGPPPGPAHVVINLGAIMGLVEAKDAGASEVPYIIAECVMHEVMHALEQWAGVEFSEDRIHGLLDKYRNAAKEDA